MSESQCQTDNFRITQTVFCYFFKNFLFDEFFNKLSFLITIIEEIYGKKCLAGVCCILRFYRFFLFRYKTVNMSKIITFLIGANTFECQIQSNFFFAIFRILFFKFQIF
jgi:hypothetical protein